MDKLGFTFYPKDWWTSETFFEFTPEQRYIYLECLFIMYSNDGYMKTQKTQLENRLRTQISDEVWAIITEKFIFENNGFTHPSVNKRLRKTIANRENGQKGGRPKKDIEKTQKTQFENPKKPTLEREREREREEEIEIELKEKKKKKEKSAPVDIYENIENYNLHIQNEFKALQFKIENEYRNVLKLEKQMTIGQYNQLRQKWSMDDIETKISVIENDKKHHSKTSVYLTLNNWLKSFPISKQTSIQKNEPYDIKKEILARNTPNAIINR